MKNKLKFSLIFCSIFISTLTAFAGVFPDVDDNQMYSTAIEFLSSNGIVGGYPDGSYGPDIILNRAELLKIIAEGKAKILNEDSAYFDDYKSAKCFSDVKPNQWYTKYVCYAKDNFWVEGYEKGKYFVRLEVQWVNERQ